MRKATKVTAVSLDGNGRLRPVTEGYGGLTQGYGSVTAGYAAAPGNPSIIRRPAPPQGWTAAPSTNQTPSTDTSNNRQSD